MLIQPLFKRRIDAAPLPSRRNATIAFVTVAVRIKPLRSLNGRRSPNIEPTFRLLLGAGLINNMLESDSPLAHIADGFQAAAPKYRRISWVHKIHARRGYGTRANLLAPLKFAVGRDRSYSK